MQRLRSTGPNRRRAFVALAALLLALGALLSTAAERPNGAGLVVRHNDGTLIYSYVQFEEETISGIDLLSRSGLDVTIAPFGGLGGAVCAIEGEGCPSDNCFCHSYSSPAFYWHYYVIAGEAWTEYPIGPSSRWLVDGDIDGWSWTAGESGLPSTNIDEIAALNGFDRSPPEPTPTPEPAPTETPLPTATPEPPPTDTPLPLPTDTPVPTATNTHEAVAEQEPTVTPASSPTATVTATIAPETTATTVANSAAIPAATVTSTTAAVPTSRAVVVAPGATPVVLVSEERPDGGNATSYLAFLGMAAVVLVVGGFAIARNRQGAK